MNIQEKIRWTIENKSKLKEERMEEQDTSELEIKMTSQGLRELE